MSPTISRSGRTWQVGTLTYSLGGLTALFGWLLWGDLAWSVRDRAIPGVMQLLFGRFGASAFAVGVLFASLPAALGVIIGPVVGYSSDRLRTRWGRRIPFLIGTTPFVVLAVAALAFSPQLGGQLHHVLGPRSPGLNSCVLIVLGFLWTVFEVAYISLIFLGVAVIYGAGFTLMCFRVREGEYPPPPRVPGGAQNPLAAHGNGLGVKGGAGTGPLSGRGTVIEKRAEQGRHADSPKRDRGARSGRARMVRMAKAVLEIGPNDP